MISIARSVNIFVTEISRILMTDIYVSQWKFLYNMNCGKTLYIPCSRFRKMEVNGVSWKDISFLKFSSNTRPKICTMTEHRSSLLLGYLAPVTYNTILEEVKITMNNEESFRESVTQSKFWRRKLCVTSFLPKEWGCVEPLSIIQRFRGTMYLRGTSGSSQVDVIWKDMRMNWLSVQYLVYPNCERLGQRYNSLE